MKTAVSVPDDLFDDGERLAQRLGWSRSKLYSKAIEAYVAANSHDEVTAALDRIADAVDPTPSINTGRGLIDAGRWEW